MSTKASDEIEVCVQIFLHDVLLKRKQNFNYIK